MVFETKDTVDGIPTRRGWLLPISMLGDCSKELGAGGGNRGREGKAGDMEMGAPMWRGKANEAELEIPEASAGTGFIQRLPQFIQRLGLTGREESRDLPSGEAKAAHQPYPHCLRASLLCSVALLLPLTVGLFVLSFVNFSI